MKTYMVLILALCSFGLYAERGLTVAEVPAAGEVSEIAVPVSEFLKAAEPLVNSSPHREDWYPSQELDLGIRLGAKQQYGMQFDNPNATAVPYGSMGSLSPAAIQAVDKAPSWMEAELSSVLAALLPERQLIWAQLILDTQDPYVDEVAFAIAYSSVEYLNSSFALPQLFTENAEDIYSIDADLSYVQVIDTGSAANGGSYYSSTRYYKKDAAGQTQQVTVPRDIYYWYIVHPKLTDEIAAYIDPAVIENNSTHNNNIVAPPQGKFWRNYLYTLDDGEHPVLADTLNECQTLFNRDGSGNDAIRTIQWWINQNMSFTSNNERPHQPVRIIAKRMGRCGEYADLSSAVARLALIPCTSILSVSTDHTWNEFWDENWVAWEPVNGYIDNPLAYENGWGKVFGSVFEIRSDGLFTPVTDRYSEGSATIQIQVSDLGMQPVDGARVVLAILDGSNRYDCEQYTNNNGIATFIVGENRNYRARVETTFGIFPAVAGTYVQLVENALDGETYQYILVIPVPMPGPNLEQLSAPDDPIQDHRFAVEFQCPGYYISSLSLWDDISSLGTQPLHYKYVGSPSSAAFMVMDANNLLFWQLDGNASAYSYVSPAMNGTGSFDIPIGQFWYGFMDNSFRHRNAIKLSGAMIYERYGTSVEDEITPDASFRMLSSHPNPFVENSTLELELSKQSEISTKVYNLKGQLVHSWPAAVYPKGKNTIVWDATDNQGKKVASGIYLWKVQCGSLQDIRKVVVSK